jgi:biopolymer transport protein ExbD
MSDLFSLARIGGALTITGLCGVGLQVVAVFLAVRRRRLVPIVLSGVALLALLLVGYLMVEHRWARVIDAVQGADPASRQEVLESPSRRLTSLQVFPLAAAFAMLQALLAAVAVGLSLSNRGRPEGLRPGVAVGVSLASVVLTVVPLGAGVVMFYRRWQEAFGAVAGADPAKRCELLLVALPEPRAALTTAATLAAVGLVLSSILFTVLALRRRTEPRGPSGVFVVAVALCCAAASTGLWQMARRYRLDAPPPDGPLKRYLEVRKRPYDWIDRVRNDPDLLAESTSNVVISDDMVPPRSTIRGGCKEALSVIVTRKAILVEGEPVAAVKRGAVDASDKRDGMSGYLIEPLFSELQKHATRLKKIEKMTGGKMTFDGRLKLVIDHRTPYRLVSEVLYSAGQAEFGSFRFVTISGKHAGGCLKIDTPRYEATADGVARVTDHPPLNLTVATSYKGFIIGGAGQVLPGPDGQLPTIKCSLALRDRRCPVAPKADGWTDGYDYTALTAKVSEIKKRHPEERRVIVSADRLIPFQVVVRTLDALRGECESAGSCTLFDQVVLSAGVE